jgi:hypothetical protein
MPDSSTPCRARTPALHPHPSHFPHPVYPLGKEKSQNFFWDQRHSEEAVCKDNLIRVMRLSAKEGQPLLPEPAEVLVEELRFLRADFG